MQQSKLGRLATSRAAQRFNLVPCEDDSNGDGEDSEDNLWAGSAAGGAFAVAGQVRSAPLGAPASNFRSLEAVQGILIAAFGLCQREANVAA